MIRDRLSGRAAREERTIGLTSRSVAAGALVILILLGFPVAYGAPFGDAALYLAYQVGFLVVPGWLVYRALCSRPGGALRQLALGWALGYVLEILAFMGTAAIGARPLFFAYPLVVAGLALAWILRREGGLLSPGGEDRLSGRFTWLLAGVCVAAMAYIGFAFFPGTPLPGAETVDYFQDYPWAISIAAEAKNHWPIQDPSVSGEPFPYHFFVHIHLAAGSQATGLELPLVFFRLWILPLVTLFVLLMVVTGQSLARSLRVGLIAACLALFVGQLQLDTADATLGGVPFVGVFFTYLVASPTFLFGLVMFVPLIILIGERIGPAGEKRDGWAALLLVTLFLVGASDAKTVILPLVVGGLLLFAGWSWLVSRQAPRAVWQVTALTLLVLIAVYLVQYRGHSRGVAVGPLPAFDFFTNMPAVRLIRGELLSAIPDFPGEAFLLSIGGIAFGTLGLLAAPLAGLALLVHRQGVRLDAGQAWLLSLFVAGLIALLVLHSPTGNDLYFFFTALVAACIVSAQGLRKGWKERPRSSGASSRLLAIFVAWAVVLVAWISAPDALALFRGPGALAQTYIFWFGGLLLSLVVLYVVVRTGLGTTRWAAAALTCGAVIGLGSLDTPIHILRGNLAGRQPIGGESITPALFGALTWIREETPSETVIAVNKQTNELGPYEFNYGAFSERRVFLAGWGYSEPSVTAASAGALLSSTNPYPERLALNRAAFEQAHPDAISTLRQRYGVRYLLVDHVQGYPADVAGLSRYSSVAYRAPGITVLELTG